jgi:hypothetical protein
MSGIHQHALNFHFYFYFFKKIDNIHGIFVIFRNNLNEFWIFYRGTNKDYGSPWPGLPVPHGNN